MLNRLFLTLFFVSPNLVAMEYKLDDLMQASTHGKIRKVQEIIQSGFDVDAQDAHGNTALMWACKNNQPEVAFYLIKQNADFNKKNNFGVSVLFFAEYSGNEELIKYLKLNNAQK